MNTTFLDYYKTILDKVSFDKKLLKKEYSKALRHLDPPERKDLIDWAKQEGFHYQLEYEKIKVFP